MQDLWALFRVDVRDVFTGKCTAAWVLGFVERVFCHPFSVVRAKSLGADEWRDWYGWDKVAAKVAEGSDLLIASNTEKGKKAQRVWVPAFRATPEVLSMDAAAALLMSLNNTG